MDRFYPLGLPSAEDVWKTTYEVQNDMRSYERSAYPPGTAVHQPGARDMFGFSTPGPIAGRLSKPELALTQEVDLPNPREHHAVVRMQEPDDRYTFHKYDVPEMMRSYKSNVATMSLSPAAQKSFTRTRSLPALERRPVPPRLSPPPEAITNLEDDHFDYFVPKGLQHETREKLHTGTLSRLKKTDRISFPFTGEGTGFRAQSTTSGWRLSEPGLPLEGTTTQKASYTKPPFYRISALQQSTAFKHSMR
mmetsp:Transcript_52436/g.121936  ORF Transcript_52436/g.121936 Transcript_52436/m.121936 type:complete len:249 (-) Transcript_52436:87-833(-)